MNKFLTVYQIYFQEKQLEKMREDFPDYTPYLNSDCTVFFESEVIRSLIQNGAHFGSDYFAVVSYKLKEKLGYTMKEKWKSIPNIANHSTEEFTPEAFEHELKKHQPDVMSFQRHPPHDPVMFANSFHPPFSQYFKKIMADIGYSWAPTRFEDVFYCNYFAARSEIYADFVNKMLAPAMDVMKGMPELMGNSRYPSILPEHLIAKFGITHYPYHPFLCERMFSFYVHINKLKAMHF